MLLCSYLGGEALPVLDLIKPVGVCFLVQVCMICLAAAQISRIKKVQEQRKQNTMRRDLDRKDSYWLPAFTDFSDQWPTRKLTPDQIRLMRSDQSEWGAHRVRWTLFTLWIYTFQLFSCFLIVQSSCCCRLAKEPERSRERTKVCLQFTVKIWQSEYLYKDLTNIKWKWNEWMSEWMNEIKMNKNSFYLSPRSHCSAPQSL